MEIVEEHDEDDERTTEEAQTYTKLKKEKDETKRPYGRSPELMMKDQMTMSDDLRTL